jgi:hypothetical protein
MLEILETFEIIETSADLISPVHLPSSLPRVISKGHLRSSSPGFISWVLLLLASSSTFISQR